MTQQAAKAPDKPRSPIVGAALSIKEGRAAMMIDHHGLPSGVVAVFDEAQARYGIESNGHLILDVKDAQSASIGILSSVEAIVIFERHEGGDGFHFHPSVPVARRSMT